MNITREQRKELDALSKAVYGTSSKWKKLLDKGYLETLTEEKEETVPGQTNEDGTVTAPTVRKVQVPKYEHGINILTRQVRYHTFDSMVTLLRLMKKQKDDFAAAVAKAQQEKQVSDQVHNVAAGSVL
jgi:hypothetical protein